MSKTIKELEMEILEYEEMIDELTPQLCGDENDEEFEKEIGYYEMLIKNNKDLIRFLEKKKIQKRELKFNGTDYLFKEDYNNNTFKIYVDGEIEKTMIHIYYFPNTIYECIELIEEYQI